MHAGLFLFVGCNARCNARWSVFIRRLQCTLVCFCSLAAMHAAMHAGLCLFVGCTREGAITEQGPPECEWSRGG